MNNIHDTFHQRPAHGTLGFWEMAPLAQLENTKQLTKINDLDLIYHGRGYDFMGIMSLHMKKIDVCDASFE